MPFNQLIPHFQFGNNEAFGVLRGTATVPSDAPGGITAGGNRSPTSFQLDLGVHYPPRNAQSSWTRRSPSAVAFPALTLFSFPTRPTAKAEYSSFPRQCVWASSFGSSQILDHLLMSLQEND